MRNRVSAVASVTFRRFRHFAGILVPRSRKVRVTIGVIIAVLLLVIAGFTAVVAPRSRADALLEASVPHLQALTAYLDNVMVVMEQQKALCSRLERAVSGDWAQQMRQNAQNGQTEVLKAMEASGQMQFIANSFGRSVQVWWIPPLLSGNRVVLAQEHLTADRKAWQELDQVLRTQFLVFAHAEQMATVMRDFLAYKPEIDIEATIDLTNQELLLLRIDRTLAALEASIRQTSASPTPDELLTDQESWLKQFMVATALLAEIRSYTLADDFRGAMQRVPWYIETVHKLQDDMLETMKSVWCQPAHADTLGLARARAGDVAVSISGLE